MTPELRSENERDLGEKRGEGIPGFERNPSKNKKISSLGSSEELARMEVQEGVNRKGNNNKGLGKAGSSLGLLDGAGTVLNTFTNIISSCPGDGDGQTRPKQGSSLPRPHSLPCCLPRWL